MLSPMPQDQRRILDLWFATDYWLGYYSSSLAHIGSYKKSEYPQKQHLFYIVKSGGSLFSI